MSQEISKIQIRANRENGKLGGVKTSQGKEISKYNAEKHGILKAALTAFEEGAYKDIQEELTDYYRPTSPYEEMLIETVAVCRLRLLRISIAEQEYIKSFLEHEIIEEDMKLKDMFRTVIREGFKARIDDAAMERLYTVYQRYNTTVENHLFRALRELERLREFKAGGMGSFGEDEVNSLHRVQ